MGEYVVAGHWRYSSLPGCPGGLLSLCARHALCLEWESLTDGGSAEPYSRGQGCLSRGGI